VESFKKAKNLFRGVSECQGDSRIYKHSRPGHAFSNATEFGKKPGSLPPSETKQCILFHLKRVISGSHFCKKNRD